MNSIQNARYVLVLLLLILSMPIQAEDKTTDKIAEVQNDGTLPEIGESTKAWLDLQGSGSQASANKQTLPGPVMGNIYGRYVESFNRPIPQPAEQYARTTK